MRGPDTGDEHRDLDRDDLLAIDVPALLAAGISEGEVSTVKIEGSAWSNRIGPTGEKRRRSYL